MCQKTTELWKHLLVFKPFSCLCKSRISDVQQWFRRCCFRKTLFWFWWLLMIRLKCCLFELLKPCRGWEAFAPPADPFQTFHQRQVARPRVFKHVSWQSCRVWSSSWTLISSSVLKSEEWNDPRITQLLVTWRPVLWFVYMKKKPHNLNKSFSKLFHVMDLILLSSDFIVWA